MESSGYHADPFVPGISDDFRHDAKHDVRDNATVMRHTPSQQQHTLGCPVRILPAIALPCLLVLLFLGGCAKPESRSWAQTAPVIMPEKRPAADSTVLRDGPAAAPDAAAYAGSTKTSVELH